MVIAKINELLVIKCNPCVLKVSAWREDNSRVIIAEWFCELKWIIDQTTQNFRSWTLWSKFRILGQMLLEISAFGGPILFLMETENILFSRW